MSRREKLIASVIGEDMDATKAKMLDATLKLILADMGQMYCKFWETEGAGVMCFQPDSDRTMFFMTLSELYSAQEQCERDNNEDLAETFRRILQRAAKIDPQEKAGYIINDEQGIRYMEVDYNKVSESK